MSLQDFVLQINYVDVDGLTSTTGRFKTEVTGHCFANAEIFLNVHNS